MINSTTFSDFQSKEPSFNDSCPRGYKTFFMLNSAEHEIVNAHRYKNIKKFSFLCSYKPKMLFFLPINVKMPTIVGILTFMSRKISCSAELGMKEIL